MSHQHPIEKVKVDVKELHTKVSNLVTEHSTLVEEVATLRTRVEAPPSLQDQNVEFLVTQLRLERELRISLEEQFEHERGSKTSLEEQLQSEREKLISAEEQLRVAEEKLRDEQVAGERRMKKLQEKLHAAEQESASFEAMAKVNQRDSDGRTQLDLAAREGDLAKVEELLSQGADANLGNNYGWTPLHLAARYGHVKVCASLLDKGGANVNARNNYMWSPLHSASYYGNVDVVKLLRERGADATAKDERGQSAWDVAGQSRNEGRTEEMRRLLAQAASEKR